MRILINDHAGHPFQVQLSRSLASHGHSVLHTFCAGLQTPRGSLQRKPEDPLTFTISPILVDMKFDRYRLLKRFIQEKALGRALVKKVKTFKPNVVISANTPLGTQSELIKICKKNKIRFIFWLQDFLGIGIKQNLSKKLPRMGKFIGNYYINLEHKLLKSSQAVVMITDDFMPIVEEAGLRKIYTIHNWAPINELPKYSRYNDWNRGQGLENKFCFLYSGTLGMKHNPDFLLALCLKYRRVKNIRIVVITEGLGGKYLKNKKEEMALDNLVLLPFQPFEKLPLILASADVLIAILEKDAGVFSVPSKVLTYLCAKRPILLAVPRENLAARIVAKNLAGIVVSPNDYKGFVKASEKLYQDKVLRKSMAENGRNYAENHFDIEKITDQFEKMLSGIMT